MASIRWCYILPMQADEIHLWNDRIAAGEDCFLELYESLSQDAPLLAFKLRSLECRRILAIGSKQNTNSNTSWYYVRSPGQEVSTRSVDRETR